MRLTALSLIFISCFCGFLLYSSLAFADCADPVGTAGEREYFTADHDYKFCDGTDWVSMIATSAPSGGGGGSSGDSYFSNVVLLQHFDSNFSDSSGSNHTATVSGDAAISATQSKFGGSAASFDGTGDYYSFPLDNDWAFDNGDFTVEAWIRLNNINKTQQIFEMSGPGQFPFQFYVDSTNVLKFYTSVSGGTAFAASTALSAGQWYHVAITRSGTTMRLFLNGNVDATSTGQTANYSYSTTWQPNVGRQNSGATSYLDGYIDELRVTKGVARYTANFSVPTAAFPDSGPATTDPSFSSVALLTHFDTNLSDSSNSAHTLTAYGNAAISTPQQKYGAASVYFDGTGDYLSTPDNAAWTLSSGDWTIEMWVRLDTLTNGASNYQCFLGQYADDNNRWNICYSGTDDWLYIASGVGGSFTGTHLASSAQGINAGQWYHIAAVRSGTTTSFYVDGVLKASSTVTYTDISSPLNIGYNYYSGGQFTTKGYIDDLRITKGVARYTSGFTPPTTPFPNG